MRGFIVACACFIAFVQIRSQSTDDAQQVRDYASATIPSSDLVFSEPKLDSPVQLPSSVMSGGPRCGPEGRAFLQIMAPPPMYSYKIIYSVTPDGKSNGYPLDRISGLSNPATVAFDPGLSMPVLLLRASDAGGPKGNNFYLALFNYTGELRNYTKLDLGIRPSGVAQLSDDSFLIVGADTTTDKPKFIVVDSSGRVLRDLDTAAIMPSDEKLKSILGSLTYAGPVPKNLPESMKVLGTLSLMVLAHSDRGLLILLPGAETRVIELLRSGEIRVVPLRLPQNQVADSLITNKGKWFFRTYPRETGGDWSFYEVDPETGTAVRRINTSGVPATSIACPAGNGFYGFKWIEHKPYIIVGDLK